MKVRKKLCSIILSFLFLFLNLYHVEVKAVESPPTYLMSTEGDVTDANGVRVRFEFRFYLQSYDRYQGTAVYKVKSAFWLGGRTYIYPDHLYINGNYIGTFNSYQGWQVGGNYERTETFYVTFHEGKNKITTNGGGVGGNSGNWIEIPKFRHFKVRFVDYDNHLLKEQNVEPGMCATAPPNPTRHGYNFTGWDRGYCNVQSDITVKAQYTPWKHEVRYDAKGGKNAPKTQIKTFHQQLFLSNQVPTKEGYTFERWELKQLKESYQPGQEYSRDQNGGYVVLEAVWSNSPPQIEAPVQPIGPQGPTPSQIPPFIEDGNVIIQKGDPVNPTDYVQATDKEDGDLSDRVVIENDTIPRDENGNTTESGSYEVEVSVTDNAGDKSYGTVNVIVNDPPVIEGEDRYFYASEEITDEMLMERVKAKDKEDGDITKQAKIQSHNVQSGVVGEYDITYEVTDKYRMKAITKNKVYIISDEIQDSKKYIRFINEKYLNTLQKNSIWRNSSQFSFISNSLKRSPKTYVWRFDEATIQKIKEFNKQHDYSFESNLLFYETFHSLMKGN